MCLLKHKVRKAMFINFANFAQTFVFFTIKFSFQPEIRNKENPETKSYLFSGLLLALSKFLDFFGYLS